MVNKGAVALIIPPNELLILDSPKANINAGTPFPKNPAAANHFHRSLGIVRILYNTKGDKTIKLMETLNKATSIGVNERIPNFINMKELPQVAASIKSMKY
jgi:hypothetical protein